MNTEKLDPRALSGKAGSLSSLIIKHLNQNSPEYQELQKMPKTAANEKLKNIVASFVEETESPAVVRKIEQVLAEMEKQNYDRNIGYLWQIMMKGDGLSMNKQKGSWY